MRLHKFIKNFSSLIVAQVIYKALTFIIMIFTARFLGPYGLGKLSYASSFVWAFLFISDFGFTELFIRDVSNDRNLLGKYVNNIITLKIFVSVAVYLVIAALAFILSFRSDKFFPVLILGLSVILDSFIYFLRSLFRVRETMEYEGILMVVESALKLIVIIVMIHIKTPWSGVLIVCGCMLLASIINLIINWITFIFNYRDFSFSIDERFWIYLLKSSFPFALAYILCFINFRVNILMLSIMLGDLTAGLYTVNYKLLEQALIIPITLSYVSFPFFSRFSGSLTYIAKIIRKVIRALLITSFIILFAFILFGSSLVSLIFGKGFEPAGRYLFAISIVLPFFFIKPIAEKILYAIGKQNKLFMAYCFGVLLNIILGLIMIPHWKIVGVSIATFISEFAIIIIAFIIYRKHANEFTARKLSGLEKESQISNEIVY